VTRCLRKKGLLLAERQSVQAEPDALEPGDADGATARTARARRRAGQVVSPGYSLHASTVVAAGDRAELERLLRYCARPSLSHERLRETMDGRYAYELKYLSLGRTHLVLTPTELLARRSLLVAPPRYPLVRLSLSCARAARGARWSAGPGSGVAFRIPSR
jgi:hypothetical protein